MNKLGVVVVAVLAAIVLALPGTATAGVAEGHAGWYWGNPLPQGRSLHDLAFAGGGRGYAVGDFGTILRTDDGGSTWIGLSTGLTVDLRHVRTITGDSFVAAGGCALRRSDDAGQSFRRLPWTASDLRCTSSIAAVFFASSNVGYLMLDNGNVLRTSDGGETWARRTAVPQTRATNPSSQARPSDLFFVDENTGLAAIGANILYRTRDGGSTWTPVTNPHAAVRGLWFTNGSDGYAVGDAGLVIKSDDGGQTWGDRTTGATDDNLRAIRCADSSTCVVTTGRGNELLRTTNGADSFTSVSPATKRLFAAAFSSGSRAVAVGQEGTTVISNDAAETFSRVGDELGGAFTSLRAATSSTAYAFGRAGSLARTTDGGQTWTEMDAATSDDLVDVSFPNTTTGFALDSVGQLLRTRNGGQSYEILNTGATDPPDAVLAVDESRVILVGPVGLRRSTNGGNSFIAVRSRGTTRAGFGDVGSVGRFLFAWGSRAIAVSPNGGTGWRRVPRPLRRADIEKVDFVSSRRGFVLYSSGRLFRTANGGRSWTEILATGTEGGYDMDFSDSRHGYLAIEEFGDDASGYVLQTDDGGVTWEPQLVDSEPLRVRGIATESDDSAFSLTEANHLFGTDSGGSSGDASQVTLSTRTPRIARPGTVRIDGRLSPAEGGEQIVVSLRSRGDPRWIFVTVTAATNGTFTVFAPVSRTSRLVAQWAGDDDRRGDGSGVLRV
ncbi:MAG: YCF48-related protein, partial [Actinomycetota bacterium]|nr:YCF48-related protein [Actinomycetota bacterium]